MGNRAVVAINETKSSPAIYLHWNGGVESVLAFLEAAKQLGIRDPEGDPDYFLARFGQMVGNFFGGTTSLGFGRADRMDDSDNGTYVLGAGFVIKSRSIGGPKALEDLNEKGRAYYQGVLDLALERNRAIFERKD